MCSEQQVKRNALGTQKSRPRRLPETEIGVMFTGMENVGMTPHSTRRRIAWFVLFSRVILFLAVAGLFCLANLRFSVHRPVDDDDRLAAELKAPKSIDQLRANIATVGSQVPVAYAKDPKSGHWKILKLTFALYSVLLAHPELAEAWQAAGSIITSRAVPMIPAPSEVCGREHKWGSNSSDPASVDHEVLPKYNKCTIVLDDAPQIVKSNPLSFKHRATHHASGERRPLLRLENAHVIYGGGEILPIDALACVNCTFEFHVASAPPKRGRSLIRALLIAPDISNVGVEISEEEPTLKVPNQATHK